MKALNHDSPNSQILRCCYSYGVSGMTVLVIGAILPALIEEAKLSYGAAGSLLSLMAVGNLAASFIFPAVQMKLGRKASITLFSAFVPCVFGTLLFLPPLWVLWLIMLALGIARGSITILNNMVVDEISCHSARAINLLHCCFAIGAFLAPFLTGFSISMGLGWRAVTVLLAALSLSSSLLYATGNYDTAISEAAAGRQKKGAHSSGASAGPSFMGLPRHMRWNFYIIATLLFFYIGFENCVNGWFVTYLQNRGIMSEAFATTLVSITWLVIMAGRLFCAWISRNCSKQGLILAGAVGTGICFSFLLRADTIVPVTLSLVGIGFFMSGLYPTCIACAGPALQGSAAMMSVLTAISAIGGIITPQIVGITADKMGMAAAIPQLTINALLMCAMAILAFILGKKERCT